MDKPIIEQMRDRMEDAGSILISSHIGADGDAVCSVLALGLALQDKGKAVQMVLSESVSDRFAHLEGVEQIKTKADDESVDLVIALDSGDEERLGKVIKGLPGVGINIDHHVTNTMFGAINLVDPESVAACAMLAEHFEALDLQFSPAVVDALLTGMLTDTLGLRTSNMTGKALRIAASLVERGADIQVLFEHALLGHSYVAMRYWGAGLSKLKCEEKLLWTTLTLEDRENTEYTEGDDAELINFLAATKGAAITLIFIEQVGKQIKVSWRSRGDYDVAAIASSFGGGGHQAASGATVAGDLENVQARVLDATREALHAIPA